VLRSHPGPTSAVASVLFALSLLAFGSRSVTPVGLALAVGLAVVFGVAMYSGMRRWRGRADSD
jgi:hypothetical protein